MRGAAQALFAFCGLSVAWSSACGGDDSGSRGPQRDAALIDDLGRDGGDDGHHEDDTRLVDAAEIAHESGDAELDSATSEAGPHSSDADPDAAVADAVVASDADAGRVADADAGHVSSEDAGDDASPGPPEFTERGAVFQIQQAGRTQQYDWRSRPEGNSVCRFEGDYLYVSIGRDAPEQSPNLDFDLCNFDGPGMYQGVDPFQARCLEGSRHFDIVWHDDAQEAGVFVSKPSSQPCELTVAVDGADWLVDFACGELRVPDGSSHQLAVRGRFRCAVASKP